MSRNKVIEPINGLRGVGAVTVMVGHFAPFPAAPAIGVILFFIISGFLIGMIYLEKEFTAHNVWQYAVARYARVYPLFVVVVLGVGFLNYVVPSANIFELGADRIVPHLLHAGDGHTIWTISAEFQFYALFLIIWWATNKRSILPILLPLFLISVVSMYWIGTSAGRINLLGYLPIFLIGLIISRITNGLATRQQRWATYALPIAALLYAAEFLAVPHLYDGRWIYLDPIVITICAVLLLSCLLAGDNWINRLLSSRPMVWLGEISFSIYLLHRVAQWITETTFATLSDRYTTPMMMILTLAMAQLANITIEKPCRSLLRDWGNRLELAVRLKRKAV